MSRPPVRMALLAALSTAAALIFSARVAAISERYQHKFPCAAGQTCYYTNGPHVNGALDFQIGDPSQSDVIHAMAEGYAGPQRSDADTCSPTGHLGRYVEVQDVFGNTEKYGHLASWIVNNQWVLQGDELAVEGNTGNAEKCAIHLHWEPGGASTEWIDGTHMPDLTPITTVTSTNSVIGETSAGYRGQQGQAIRDEYFRLGAQAGNYSWWVVGWTSDPTGVSPERVWMRRDGAGYEHTFLHEPAYVCSGKSAIYAADLYPGAGYWVGICDWQAWQLPASNHPSSGLRATGYPRREMEPAYCAPELPACTQLQAFHFGYLWWAAGALGPTSVVCPDADGNTYMNIVDVQRVGRHYYLETNDARCDVNADTAVNILDVLRTAQIALIEENNRRCYQWRVPGGQVCPPI